MNLVNHYKMAETIYRRMKKNGVCLRRLPFILGNLVPDICFSFVFRRHEYDCSAASVRKIIFRLHEGRFDPRSALFAYLMGIVSHYVCDYFCYSHSPAFRGNLWDHIKYEWGQRMETSGEISFHGQEGHRMGFHHLMNTMDEHIRNHDRVLAQGITQTDIGMGMSTAGWLAEAVFSSAEIVYGKYPRTVFHLSFNGDTVIQKNRRLFLVGKKRSNVFAAAPVIVQRPADSTQGTVPAY